MSLIDVVASVFGLASVILVIRRNVWNWPAGLVQVVLSVAAMYREGLYSDMVLQIIFVPVQVYGWWHWLYGRKEAEELPITRLTGRGVAAWALVAAVAILVDGYVMERWFGAKLPYWDGAILVLSLVAQYLIARKVIDNWPIWIAVDILSVGVFTVKEMYAFAGLYAVFLVLASFGWAEWIRAMRRQEDPPPPKRGFEVVMG